MLQSQGMSPSAGAGEALLQNHSDHGWIATTCTVSSSVAFQHPNCGALPPIRAVRPRLGEPQTNVSYVLTGFV